MCSESVLFPLSCRNFKCSALVSSFINYVDYMLYSESAHQEIGELSTCSNRWARAAAGIAMDRRVLIGCAGQ